MNEVLWFVYENEEPVAVFESRHDALKSLRSMRNDESEDEYELKSIELDDLEEDSEEYELAIEEGLV